MILILIFCVLSVHSVLPYEYVRAIQSSMGHTDDQSWVIASTISLISHYCGETNIKSTRVLTFFEIAKLSGLFGLEIQSNEDCHLEVTANENMILEPAEIIKLLNY